MRLVALERSRNVPAVNSLFSIASVIFVLRLQCAYCQKYINKSVILYISQESQDDCLHADFQCFKLALWPTLRQKFMNFWSFLTRLGDKHDTEKIRNCSLTPKWSWSKLTILPWVSRCVNFSHDKTSNLMVLVNIILKWNVSLFNKNGKVYCCRIVSDSPHVNPKNR